MLMGVFLVSVVGFTYVRYRRCGGVDRLRRHRVAEANVLSLVVRSCASSSVMSTRIRVEEEVLEAELGDEYRDYVSTRARLILGCGEGTS